MEQLSGLDSAFIYLESGAMPMHIGSLAIYDPSTAPGGKVGFKDILKYFERRLHKARVFRQRVVHVPLGLDHPYWIEDPEFDLEYHIRHIALPHPGDWRQLCIQTARLHARPLDMNRPLWEAYVIEGLNNVEGVPEGSFALVTKFHHAAVDGASSARIAEAFHDLSPDTEVAAPHAPWIAERIPTGMEMLARTAIASVRTPAQLLRLARRAVPAAARAALSLARSETKVNVKVPRTRFNRTVSPHRVFDARVFSLEEIKAIKNTQPGTTVNDVVVSFCGGALRKYLQAKDELPDESLVAMAPVSARTDAIKRDAGNMVSAMSLPVSSNLDDPVERLLAVHEESVLAKKMVANFGADIAVDAAEFLPSTFSASLARAYGRYHLAERLPPIYNTVITNVPGANIPLYSMGSQMVASYGLGPIAHGVGLFQPVVGYNGQIAISAISCREIMPDPSFYCECLQEAFDELKQATLGAKSHKPERSRKVAAKSDHASKPKRRKKVAASRSKSDVAAEHAAKAKSVEESQ